MAAVPATADIQTALLGSDAQRSGRGLVAATTKIFYGTMIARNAAGYVVPASDTAGLKVIGIAQQFVDNTAGADGALTVDYITGVTAEVGNNAGAILQASHHTLCTAADDNSVTTAAITANDIIVGTVASFTATKVLVFIDERANA